MRHIIIEGPDGAGKTTLARRLCSTYGMGYHHEGPPPADGVGAHYAGLLVNAKRPTVFDRLHLGEMVYGPLLRSGSRLAPSDLISISRIIRGSGTAVVICLPSVQTCLTNSSHKQELIKDPDMLALAHASWSAVAGLNEISVNRVLYDYVYPGKQGLQFDYMRLPDGVIGSPTATVLLVGDRVNGDLDVPFYGAKGCSPFLNECIREAGILEMDLALTNAYDIDGQARDLDFIVSQMLHLKTVVPLGSAALSAIEQQGVPPFVGLRPLPHPQYWKRRFRYKERDAYVAALRDAYVAR